MNGVAIALIALGLFALGIIWIIDEITPQGEAPKPRKAKGPSDDHITRFRP